MDSVKNLRFNKVAFAAEAKDVIEAVMRPPIRPLFKCFSALLFCRTGASFINIFETIIELKMSHLYSGVLGGILY